MTMTAMIDPPEAGASIKNTADRDAQADLLARDQPLLKSSICLGCRAHRTIVSGKGSVFLLCQSERTPDSWPKYPPQPLRGCPYFESR